MEKYFQTQMVMAEKAKYEDTPAGKRNPDANYTGVDGYNVKINGNHYAFALEKTFESQWAKNGNLPFGIAASALENGSKIARKTMRAGDYLKLDENKELKMYNGNGEAVYTTICSSDIVAHDWEILD